MFLTNLMELLGDMGHVESCFNLFKDSVSVSVQDWCMVCAKRPIASEIVLDASDGTPR